MPAAQAQIDVIRAWWIANRPKSPHLFDEELDAAIGRLENEPLLATIYTPDEADDVRRLLMPRTRYAVYFVVHGVRVDVVAIWRTLRAAAVRRSGDAAP
jgi:plasmid stabilization system protein ParE